MPDPTPNVVVAFAAFVRQRLSGMGNAVRDTVTAPLAPLLRRDSGTLAPARGEHGERRNVAMVIVAAAETFAPTAHARARLLRQAHASGLLSARETADAIDAIDAVDEQRAIGAPRS